VERRGDPSPAPSDVDGDVVHGRHRLLGVGTEESIGELQMDTSPWRERATGDDWRPMDSPLNGGEALRAKGGMQVNAESHHPVSFRADDQVLDRLTHRVTRLAERPRRSMI
jgi:hypothetical protein